MNLQDRQIFDRLSYRAIEIGGSTVLGQNVRLEFSPNTTVLVGRNGAGKSLLLNRIFGALQAAVGLNPPSLRAELLREPARLLCLLNFEQHPIRYECKWIPVPPSEMGAARTDSMPEVEEVCEIEGKEVLWTLANGVLRRNDGSEDKIPPGRTLLNWTFARRKPFTFNVMAMPLEELFWNIRFVASGIPRSATGRESLIFSYPEPLRNGRQEQRRIERLVYEIAEWHEKNRPVLEELRAVGRRIGLFESLEVKFYRDPAPAGTREDLVSLAVDGINLGLLSDGTLRVLEILTALVEPDCRLVVVEEPETAIHPGLLARILNEIESYSTDRQFVVSTHSPQVVSWAEADSLRLVARSKGITCVRSLAENQRDQLRRYLNDEGTLGDFIFGGETFSDGFEND